MSKFLRLAAFFCCSGVLVLGTVALDPNGSLLSPFWGWLAGKTSPAEALEQCERMARINEASFRRINTKNQIAEEVIARQRSLAEAMEQFRALDQERPQFDTSYVRAFHGMSEDEWDGRGVIRKVRVVLEHRPDEAAAVVARLEKELQKLLADRQKRPAVPVESADQW